MRFFKAFNILHRRTKSATFVPGPTPELSFVDVSYSGHGSSQPMTASPSLLFELATTKESTVPPNFNHLADRVSGLWRPKRSSRRSSTASAFDAMEKEHTRLKDVVQFWVSEYSKLQANLAQCRDDLLAEQHKVAAFEQKAKADSLVIEGLTGKLSHYERISTNDQVIPIDCPPIVTHSDREHAQLPILERDMVRASIDRDPNVPSGSSKLRTMDEYSSALRMTLTSRKQLREQKKITKFWKAEALAKSHDPLITPSVSAISSIHEQPLPSGRQDALKALIIRRVQTLSLLPNLVMPAPLSSSAIGTLTSTLPSSASNVSATSSRLSPLASESMKAEVNLMFGSRSSLNRLATPPRRPTVGHLRSLSSDADTAHASRSTSTASSIPIRKSLNIESFSELNGFFDKTFGSTSRERMSVEPDQLTTFVRPLAFDMTKTSPEGVTESIPSGSSGLFEDDMTQLSTPTKKLARPSLRQASKDCTPRRSWQTYISRATAHPQIAPLARTSEKAPGQKTTDKENAPVASSSLHLRNKKSRLPVPIFGRRDV